MRALAFDDLPPPPPGRSGWPWTGEAAPPRPAPPAPGPRIAIVTPSYNQGAFVEETIRSVLLQDYPAASYAIVDNFSDDATGDVLRRYAPWLTRLVVERDRGQAQAINKGFRGVEADIFQWINADDVLAPGALRRVASAWRRGACVAGGVQLFDAGGPSRQIPNLGLSCGGLLGAAGRGASFVQPALFFEADKYFALGGLREDFQYAFDWEFFIRYFDRWPGVVYLDGALVAFRQHQNSKSVAQGERFHEEGFAIRRSLLDSGLKPRHAAICRESLRRAEWRRWLAVGESAASPRRRAATVAARALLDPGVRLDRFTLGHLRELLVAGTRPS